MKKKDDIGRDIKFLGVSITGALGGFGLLMAFGLLDHLFGGWGMAVGVVCLMVFFMWVEHQMKKP